MQCEKCQGNGEIVTDWTRYLKPRPGDMADEASAECPDCDGTGDDGSGPHHSWIEVEARAAARRQLDNLAQSLVDDVMALSDEEILAEAMEARMTAAERRLEEAKARYERDKHGKDAFLGSSSWGLYVYARSELEEAEKAVAAERAALKSE